MADKTAMALCNISNSKTGKRVKAGEKLVGFTAEQVQELVKMKAARYASNPATKAD